MIILIVVIKIRGKNPYKPQTLCVLPILKVHFCLLHVANGTARQCEDGAIGCRHRVGRHTVAAKCNQTLRRFFLLNALASPGTYCPAGRSEGRATLMRGKPSAPYFSKSASTRQIAGARSLNVPLGTTACVFGIALVCRWYKRACRRPGGP